MNKTLNKLAVLAAFLLACAVPALAETITGTLDAVEVSSVMYVGPDESADWSLTGTATGTVTLKSGRNGYIYGTEEDSTVGTGAVSDSGTVYGGDTGRFFRFSCSTITAGSFTYSIADNDDLSKEFKTKGGKTPLRLFDESVRVPRIVLDDKDARWGRGENDVLSLSTATTSESVGASVFAYLSGTADAVQGSVLIATTPTSGYGFTVAVPQATADLTNWVGVAKAAGSSGTVIEVYTSGYVLARTTGTVTVGQTLVTSDAARGYLKADATPTTGADVGVACSAGISSGGLTRIRLR